MKKIGFLLFALLIGASAFSQTNEEMDRLSYGFGLLVAQNLKDQGIDGLNPTEVAAAIDDVLEGRETKMTVTEAQNEFQKFSMQKAKDKYKSKIAEGELFLENNADRKEVNVTESGLQYEVIKSGTGEIPKPTDHVTVHYEGTLLDGTVFDSSYKRGEPASFPVTGVIQGWVEALQMMKVGSKWKLYIPYNLAYGERAVGKLIKPYSTLIFDVELIDIKK